MTVLSNEDKISIVDQKIKNIEYQKYSVQLDLQIENAVSSPNESVIAAYNSSLADINNKLAALAAEKASLTE